MRSLLPFLNFLRISFLYSSHMAYPQSSPSGSQTKTIVCRKSWVGLLASVEMIGWKIKWLPGLGGLGPPAHQTDLTSTDGMFWAPFNGSVSTSLLPIIPSPIPQDHQVSRHHIQLAWARIDGNLVDAKQFLSDPSLCLPLSLTHSCLVDLMPVNDANCLMISQRLLTAQKSSKKLEKAF